MGKGDKRTKRGKIFAGSYGKTRQKPHKAAFVATEKPVVEKAPKKRTPKVVKSAPAPAPVPEQIEAATEPVATGAANEAPQTAETPQPETPEATPATGEATAEVPPAEKPAAEASTTGGEEPQATSEEAAA